jgi:hypothetical protein
VSYVDTLSRRELFRRIGRAAIAAPVLLATQEQQASLVYRLAQLFGGKDTVIGRWLRELWMSYW